MPFHISPRRGVVLAGGRGGGPAVRGHLFPRPPRCVGRRRMAQYRCLNGALLREGFDMKSKPCGKLAAKVVVECLEEKHNGE
jgi:hypothetical protein